MSVLFSKVKSFGTSFVVELDFLIQSSSIFLNTPKVNSVSFTFRIAFLFWFIADELLEIMLSYSMGSEYPDAMMASYYNLVISVFHAACRNLRELQHMVFLQPLFFIAVLAFKVLSSFPRLN
jgi:hypothetical protein